MSQYKSGAGGSVRSFGRPNHRTRMWYYLMDAGEWCEENTPTSALRSSRRYDTGDNFESEVTAKPRVCRCDNQHNSFAELKKCSAVWVKTPGATAARHR